MVKKLLIVLGLAALILLAVVVIRTWTHPFVKLSGNQPDPVQPPVSGARIQRFAKGLRFATVSFIDSAENQFAVYDSFRTFIRESYPRIFEEMNDTLINNHQWLLHWKGSNAALKPLLFMSHYDVVAPGQYDHEEGDAGQNIFDLTDEPSPPPVEEFRNWNYPPFSGAVTGGRIHGRGAIDMKSVVFALLESVDTLLEMGFVPERDIYLALDPDEEVGGLRGAAKLAGYFKQNGIRFETIYDEGGIVATPGTAEGINQNIAFVGVAEKGVVGYRIKVKGTGGHSSMPPLQTAAGRAAVIMQRIENNQLPQRLIKPTEDFLNIAGAGLGFTGRMAIANQWLFKGMLMKKMARTPQANALTRTTTAITQLKGSDGNNVLAPVVEIVINFRILPGETSQDVLAHIRKACEGFDVEIDAPRIPVEPSAISPTDGRGYTIIRELSERIYRFMPVLLNPIEQRTIHNFSEYLSIDNFSRMIAYYTFLMKNFDQH